MSLNISFAVLEEIYNNLVPNWSAVLISCIHSITLLISFHKKPFKSEINFFLYVYHCIWTLCNTPYLWDHVQPCTV